jgi:hypothetical protein
MDMEAELQARQNALDVAHKKARDAYMKAFKETLRKVLSDQHDEQRALASADGAAKRAYETTRDAVYRTTYDNEIAAARKAQ